MQEQTARTVPEIDASAVSTTLLAPAPKYLITAAWETNTAMAPAMNSAGTDR